MKENELLESKELREKLVAKVEILDKVKKLLLIPGTELANAQQVADFYEVEKNTIEVLYSRNKDELDEDGTGLVSYKDFLNLQNVSLEKSRGKTTFTFQSGEILNVPNRGLKVFPRRAILRIGMLLRDSAIAKEIRTQLLNIEEKTSNETKTMDITEEQTLALSVGMAYASGNPDAIMIATTKMMDFKNRHIAKLNESNNALANGILAWDDRGRINFAVRKMAAYAHITVGKAWSELYKQLKNGFHIDLQSRGKQPWIQHVDEKEWQCVIKAFSALCKYYELEPSDMFHDLKIEEEVKA
ncbi:hypothetical protein SAMN05443270_3054 [Lacrimispora sphenoides]|uniref:hypothetical protein n=1 Tax=Lacrimispora sphenoides TaxID=29370 RepID=UPI0008B19895|nr:hypothetical protein [Lacrimispora sphenoides]SEU08942.1 hypothetical protein SAMN05443270_3054 [Lacrimispora sphenoides]